MIHLTDSISSTARFYRLKDSSLSRPIAKLPCLNECPSWNIDMENPSPRTKGNAAAIVSRPNKRAVEKNRNRAAGDGELNELGNTEGQNGEQGNTVKRRHSLPLGKPAH